VRLPGPALALLEIESIARGIVTADAVVKRAEVEISWAGAITPGKYLLLFSGGVAEVQESFAAGRELAGSTLLDSLLLPYPSPVLTDALEGKLATEWSESLGIVETHSVAAAILAADAALKKADVTLLQLHLAKGIGGKGYFTLTGSLHMVEAALEAAGAAIPSHLLQATEIIQAPARELKGRVV
jgi:microcompartment protein CcmL/EutN